MFLVKCFTQADNEGTGKIGPDKFDALVDIAALAPRRFDFAPPAAETFKSAAEKSAARKEWLTFSYSHICEKAKTLDPALSEHRDLYQFLLKCFTAADSDFDGKVSLGGFR